MFTLQVHNQALVLNAVNPRSYLSLRRFNLPEERLEKSICEAAKNCTEINLKEVPIQALKSPLLNNNANEILRPSRVKKSQDMTGFVQNALKQTIEQNPVFRDKIRVITDKSNMKITSQLAKSLANKIVFSSGPSNIYFQIRNFKTDRSISAETLRNPSLITRVRSILGIEENSTPTMKDDKLIIGSAELDRMKTMMADEGLSLEEQQKIKVAFAEGYLACHGNKNQSKTVKWLKVLQHVLTIILFFGIFVSLMASASGSVFRIQLGNQSEVDPEEINVTFNDVKGVDEAKQELKDVVEFLKNPEKFSSLGGKLPKGVLLVGPPGTGKTLLARAVAGEAGVPFFHAAGPEFDEILVGQGARRVRDLFKAAKERAPCVIFIDEIDSVGAKRTNAVLHPYANQTINQLLSEMDGFHQNEGVIVLGATNRREDLDKALLRPGRFDVEVNVPAPDYSGRKEILTMYLGRIRSKNVDVDILARGTTGFTGADLENMINQAALRAAIDGADFVTMKYLEVARDKVIMGPERKSRIMDDETNEITAYHEGGHAVVAYYTKDSHPLHKVTIIPRGPSLGHTAYIPEKERYHVTKSQLLAMMDTMMGGRAAEELIFGADKITSGASSDLKQATAIATHMVKDWGMSEKAGLRTHDTDKQGLIQINELSPSTSAVLDNEIQRILQESYERAKLILKNHQKEHKLLAEALLKYETLDADDIKAIMSGKKEPEKDLASRKEPQKKEPTSTTS
ncbi:ATP-dependent zinc metalloprotease YME1L-like isoform X2 [Macrosteles quadrilineatus]|uniref:ATP-dependent zinc metalloprotease YME1L-like isoform X2 n=1 Tax=Macrosteles quadrilineatus TaxID=74068 RepID=UPI0023E15829|nr:ATP-dependent zinc metalloprotease YME1L-like isoform X2 [Macrosteles quadrilineatus]